MTKKESRFSANFPYLILALLTLFPLYFWFETYNLSRLKIPMENPTVEDGATFVVILGCLTCAYQSIKKYFTN